MTAVPVSSGTRARSRASRARTDPAARGRSVIIATTSAPAARTVPAATYDTSSAPSTTARSPIGCR
ncbi:hypothetical protein ACIRBZ_04645 [Streptomyces sp. NPDC094038]|uniref:hypothetical protein n=1 Tax=Streptomyces sp. NPDC094038 TaxID=3366055 RepID=UPI0038090F6B